MRALISIKFGYINKKNIFDFPQERIIGQRGNLRVLAETWISLKLFLAVVIKRGLIPDTSAQSIVWKVKSTRGSLKETMQIVLAIVELSLNNNE